MKKLLLCCIVSLFVGCTDNNKKPHKTDIIVIKPITITDSIMTSLPGKLTLTGSYLIWGDPFNSTAFIKVVDIRTGKQVAQTGTIGHGPKEFVTPDVQQLSDDNIGITDLNSSKRAILNIKKLLNGEEPFTFYRKKGLKGAIQYIEVSNNSFVGLYPEESFPFKYINSNMSISFGRFPIREYLNPDERFNRFQGNIAYSATKKKLIYCPFVFPYIITYKKSGDSFTYDTTLKIYKPEYTVTNGELKFKNRVVLINELTLTKDYIAVSQLQAYKREIDNYTGMDKLPHTIYLYDYDLNLQKIVDIKAPILRLAGNEKSNTVYAIIMNPEYSIVKVELPEMDM